MSLAASYVARRAAQKERVRILYRRALKDTLTWAVHRHCFYPDADALRERFDANKNVEDIETIDRMIADGEAQYNKWRHPDPYIVPWAPGGSKFTRNPEPPKGDVEASTWSVFGAGYLSAFARFNTIITSLKALDEGYSSKNYVRKFLRALHPKWRAKVTTIEESKDLTSLSLDELIENLKAKKESSNKECSTSGSEDEEYAMTVRDFKKCDNSNHLIGECPNPPKDKNQIAFVGGSWSDSGEEDDEKAKDETCLVAQASNEVCSDSSYFSDENSSIDDLTLD
ncbi:zf-CCHC domain-containing protein, partial [Tanacetum coccineum]